VEFVGDDVLIIRTHEREADGSALSELNTAPVALRSNEITV